jgi:hypothetical protein
MPIHLSRAFFWLAAVGAVSAWASSGTVQAVLASASGSLAFAAYVTWRADLTATLKARADADSVLPARPFDAASIAEAEAQIARAAAQAPSFEAALHGVARALKGEVGARDSKVFLVAQTGQGGQGSPTLVELIPGQAAFRVKARALAAGEGVMARALAGQREVAHELVALAVPVARDGVVIALVEWRGIDFEVDGRALAGLLAAARSALEDAALLEHEGLVLVANPAAVAA